MKIALCLECPLYQHGGVEVLVRRLIEGLHHDHEIYLVSDDDMEDFRKSPHGGMIRGGYRYDPKADSAAWTQGMIAWARQTGIELFHFHLGGTYGWKARKWNACPITRVASAGFRCISTNHGAFGLLGFVGAQRPLWFKLAALLLCWPSKLRQIASVECEITVSKHDWNAVRRWFFPFRRKFIQIYHSNLDGGEPLQDEKKPYVLCLGTVGARKGQNHLADAYGRIARDFPDWRLVLAGRHAGDGTSDAMYAAIQRHDIADLVEVLTDVSDELADDLLRNAAIFAMPSLAEGLGLSLQEAMFNGAACVGSATGGITDMILDEQTGLLVPPAQPDALARGLARLMRDAPLRDRLSAKGRSWIRENRMTKQGMCARHVEIYLNPNESAVLARS